MNNNARSVNAVTPHPGFLPVAQRGTNPEVEPYSTNASYPVESASIPLSSSYYDELFNKFVQLPNEDEHGVSMLATSDVDGVSTVNHENTHGRKLPTGTRSADVPALVGSGEPNLARILSPSSIVPRAEIERLDFTPYPEPAFKTIPGWESADVTFNGFAATLGSNGSTPPQDHQSSGIYIQPPARPALPSTLTLAHISVTNPIVTNPVQTTRSQALTGTLSAAPAPPSHPATVQPNLPAEAGGSAASGASTSGSRLPKTGRKLPGNSGFISTPLRQSWTSEGEILPVIGKRTTHEPGPASKAYAREAHTATKGRPTCVGACTPSWSATNTRQGAPGPVEASSAARPTVSSQANAIYSRNHPRLNPAAPAQQSQSYPQHLDHRVYSPTQTTTTTQVLSRVHAGFIVESGGPTAALTGRSIPAPPTSPSAPALHIQLHIPTPTYPACWSEARGFDRPTAPIGLNLRAASPTRAPNRPTFQARETAKPVQPASPGYSPNDQPRARRVVPGRVAGEVYIVEMEGNEPVLVYPVAGLTVLAGSSTSDDSILGGKRRAPWGADDSSRDKRARHGGN
ncbi:hypothetical protein RSOLAG22IIIB_07767 [Rhizoctonia solani]|uniref:Uncharacterized protein n=1 Tax=Rhizoctonia solani TaxID=456999 RepID=A0A0K6FQG2_9AGAM|nr:hypothetical protein RSOLAG22IIIB_07767 [Rhizoctonia solani]